MRTLCVIYLSLSGNSKVPNILVIKNSWKMRVLQLDTTIRALMQYEAPSGPQVITEEYFFPGK